ncbi:putative cystine transporter YijE [Lentibacillus sp. JNUCC-1]|uniref:DMT family transporter n=1 Tax=Lentibacillus sp. JNUCC-1 TaxID=2654513 RepID=UPI0012E7ACF4|nr:DMT family transporter [Lentibacillus sp. JNUCC-1]MUV37219.1 putative cystine transporter YijE [Lentibacillus sp. JNUCC-1]
MKKKELHTQQQSESGEAPTSAFITYLQQHKWALVLAILIVTLLWGYAWVLMKQALDYMGPFTFSAFRFATGSITLLIVIWIRKTGLPPKQYWKHLTLVGLLQTSIVFLLVMYGLKFVDAGKSSVLLYSMPVWSSFLAAKFLNEKMSPGKVTGLLAGMIGIITIVGWDSIFTDNLQAVFGELLIIVAAFSWGMSNVYYRRHLQNLPQLQVNTWQMTCGTIGIIIAALVMEWGEPIVLNTPSIYYIMFTGVFASALCFTVWFLILSLIDMVTATISTLLVPIFGLLFSSIILNETLTPGVITGSVLIIAGIIIAQLSAKQMQKK